MTTIPQPATASNLRAGNDDRKYPEAQITAWAAEHGAAPDFRHRWIIQHGESFYVFRNGRYQRPVSRASLATKVRDDLAPAGLMLEEEINNIEGIKTLTITR